MAMISTFTRHTIATALMTAAGLVGAAMALAAPPGFVEFAPPSPGVFRGYLNIVNGPNDGFLYFTQDDNDGIGQLDPRTGTFREFIIPTQFGRPSGITVGPDGKIWFTETGAGQIGRLDPATGEVTEFPLTAATFGALQSQPRPITTGPDNNLWFVQIGPQLANVQFQSFIGRMTPAGVHTEFLVPSLSAFSLDEGITVGPDGKIWFTESNVRKVGRLDPATGVVTEFDMGSARAPLSITRGPDGNLWAGTNAGLARITTAGIVTHFDLPQAQGNDEVFGITSGADGHIWFTLGFALGLGRIDPATEQVGLFPIGSFQLDRFPYGITRGPDGNIWYTDLNANRIGQASLLSILPAPGTFVTAQSIDVLVVNHAAGRVATGGQMRLTTLAPVPTLPRDVTAEFLGCVVGGRLRDPDRWWPDLPLRLGAAQPGSPGSRPPPAGGGPDPGRRLAAPPGRRVERPGQHRPGRPPKPRSGGRPSRADRGAPGRAAGRDPAGGLRGGGRGRRPNA